ncbi:hypothetical protein [Haloglomus salinum]|uniref:hypothetical protein n=1 Tax=Haloglomus salinum TaxID=2962673 RepID=UPI0020CA2209|nr:hypothetical protein [Haloglomus salinum]
MNTGDQTKNDREPMGGVSTNTDDRLPLLRLEVRGRSSNRALQFRLRRKLRELLRFAMMDWVDQFHIIVLPETNLLEPMIVLYPVKEDEANRLCSVRTVVTEQPKMGAESQMNLVIPHSIVRKIFDRSRRVEEDVDSYTGKNHLLFSPIISYIAPDGGLASGVIALWPLGYEDDISAEYPYLKRSSSSSQSTLSQYSP